LLVHIEVGEVGSEASLKSVGVNATLVGDDINAFVRGLRADVDGDIDVAGPVGIPPISNPASAVYF